MLSYNCIYLWVQSDVMIQEYNEEQFNQATDIPITSNAFHFLWLRTFEMHSFNNCDMFNTLLLITFPILCSISQSLKNGTHEKGEKKLWGKRNESNNATRKPTNKSKYIQLSNRLRLCNQKSPELIVQMLTQTNKPYKNF